MTIVQRKTGEESPREPSLKIGAPLGLKTKQKKTKRKKRKEDEQVL